MISLIVFIVYHSFIVSKHNKASMCPTNGTQTDVVAEKNEIKNIFSILGLKVRPRKIFGMKLKINIDCWIFWIKSITVSLLKEPIFILRIWIIELLYHQFSLYALLRSFASKVFISFVEFIMFNLETFFVSETSQ